MKKFTKTPLILIFVFFTIIMAYSKVPPGYDEYTGRDIDECATGGHNCPPCMTCHNIMGSYVCYPLSECHGEEHIHFNVGGGTPYPIPSFDDLKNKYLVEHFYSYHPEVVVGVDDLEFGFDVYLPVGTKVSSLYVRECTVGGVVYCDRGIEGTITTDKGIEKIHSIFIEY